MRKHQAARVEDSVCGDRVHVALDLSRTKWKAALGDGSAARPRAVTIDAGDLARLGREIARARERFGLSADAPALACYEAGREGFWVQRALASAGIETVVVEPASVEVSRRSRRVKTDRVDALKLLDGLTRWARGDRRVWRAVRVPSVEAEDLRHVHRELEQLKKERTQHRCRIRSLLFTQGVDVRVGAGLEARLSELRTWDDAPLPEHLRGRVERELVRLRAVEAQIRAVERARERMVSEGRTRAMEQVDVVRSLKGVGTHGAWVMTMEMRGWRDFSNRREVGSAAGLTGTPSQSGDVHRDQGISKAGNRRVRTLMVELAWLWLRYQPESALAKWYADRFAGGGARMRRVGIVALARRLLVDLWRLATAGVVPEGAAFKTA